MFDEDRGDDLRIARRAEHAELERRDGDVFEHAARLAFDSPGLDREQAFDTARVLHRDPGEHG